MKRVSALLGAALLAAFATMAAASPASANHNEVIASVTVEDCTLTGTSSWTIDSETPNHHQVGNTELVVLVDGVVHHAVVGTPIDVDLPAGTTEVKWRVWGGGERDYDDPVLDDLNALVEYLKGDGTSPLDPEAPGVAWHVLEVDSCPAPEPSESPAASESPEPSTTTTTTTEAAKLADTGANLTTVLAVGGLLVLAGVGALMVARRRRV